MREFPGTWMETLAGGGQLYHLPTSEAIFVPQVPDCTDGECHYPEMHYEFHEEWEPWPVRMVPGRIGDGSLTH